MPATAPKIKYNNLEEIYENYTLASNFIFFEGDVYEFQQSKCSNDTEIHLYRCENEMHNLKIYTQDGVPYLVEGLYSIKPITL